MAIAEFITIENADGTREDLPDFWNVTRDVYPGGNNISTDVMLVQTLLMIFATSDFPTAAQKEQALRIISSARAGFNDGIYGSRTRALLKIFEENSRAPFHDGIVRKASFNEMVTPKKFTKLKGLNIIWDMTLADGSAGKNKREQGRIFLPLMLFREMYLENPA